MVDFIPPLELGTWFQSVFAGTPDIFVIIALIIIASGAAFFRMTTLTLIFMAGMFLLMFSGVITSPILYLIAVLGGLAIGFVLQRIFYQ